MIKESSLIACLILTTITSAAISQPGNSIPPCQTAPDGAPQEIVDCYDQACKGYQIAWSECDSSQCRQLAHVNYMLDLLECAPQRRIRSSEWATIWYLDGEFGIAFDMSKVPEQAARFEF